MDQHAKYKSKTHKILTGKSRSKSSGPWIWRWVLRYDTKGVSNKRKKTDITDLIRIKSFCGSKDIIKKMETQPTKSEKYLEIITVKGLLSTINEEPP